MIDKGKIIFKSSIVYILELWRLWIIAMLLTAILVLLERTDIFFYIYFPISALILFFSLRRFYFYQDRIVVHFLYREDVIFLKNVRKIIYHYTGGGGGFPVVIIKIINTSTLLGKIYSFLICRFVLRNEKKLVFLLKYFNENEVEIKIESTEFYKKKLNNEISK